MAARLISEVVAGQTANTQQEADVSLTRRFQVGDLEGTTFAALYEALDVAGMPADGDVAPGHANLVVLRRRVAIHPTDAKRAIVDVDYVPKFDAKFDAIFEGGTSLKQIQTEKDRFGRPIVLQHTWPNDDADWPNRTDQQGASVTVFDPETTLQTTVKTTEDFPHYISSQWGKSINSRPWSGGPRGTWMVSAVDFVPIDTDASPREYLFRWVFQWNVREWDPEVFFIDPRTNRPPPNLVQGLGFFSIRWYPFIDFSSLFPRGQ